MYIGIAVAQVGVIVWYSLTLRKSKKEKEARKQELARMYPYEGLRNLAFNNIPGYIIANAPNDEFFIYSIIMDWNMGEDVLTLATQVTGEASLYVKSGGGIVGAGKHTAVSEATQLLFFEASKLQQSFQPSTNYSMLPEANFITFYLLTNQGNKYVTQRVDSLQGATETLHPLYRQANLLMAKMKEYAVAPSANEDGNKSTTGDGII
ncbi:MAG: hypothetical protein EBZ77_01895 [Chitinophagia bacterium]|nr:hypothetical protein [Chitinophagia bacterium]